ncbi:cytidine/deoxycytidylate deaminase family protein [Patescibacteria group bacterium]|uniref:Putative CMP/dCMP deaminase zinc-binding n=1 Tax=viral metagenome TaxID=1070528 RepID=A0A6M3M8Y2_9ZZZZ|nr:cytidine/deoxycytidylate deaminase family protein [Patescibacteria group bacterium]
MRKPWDEFFFGITEQVSQQSTCIRRQYGGVLVKDKTIISTGFNGAPRGCAHCIDIGCAREDFSFGTHHELCRATHAEQNTIANAARMGMCTMGSELYIRDIPCPICAKILINAGVAVIHYKTNDYPGWELSQKFFEEAGVILMRH